MRRLYLAALLVLATAGAGIAQERDYIPDRRAVLIEGVDFPGADLSPQFDVTFEACEAACRAGRVLRAPSPSRGGPGWGWGLTRGRETPSPS